MKTFHKLLLSAAVPLLGLAACGGSDTQDRLDVADPVVRFVHASPIAPNLTLYEGTTAQSDATNVPYKFASNYFDVDTGAADWSVKTATGAVTLGTVSIDPQRGTRYTIVALPSSSTDSSTYLIVDPTREPVTPGELTLSIYVSSDYGSGYIELAGDGTVKQINYPS